MRAVTLLTLWFSLVSLMPAEKHLLIEPGADLVKGEADQNKAWGGGWASAEKGMTNKAQKKGDPVVRNRISVDNGFWKDCEKFFSEKYCDEISVDNGFWKDCEKFFSEK